MKWPGTHTLARAHTHGVQSGTCPHVAVACLHRVRMCESVRVGGTARLPLPDGAERSEGTNCWADISLGDDVSQVPGRSEDTCRLSVFLPVTPLHLAAFSSSCLSLSSRCPPPPPPPPTPSLPLPPHRAALPALIPRPSLPTRLCSLTVGSSASSQCKKKKKNARCPRDAASNGGMGPNHTHSHTHTRMCFGMVIRWQSGGRYIPDPCLLLIRLLHSK